MALSIRSLQIFVIVAEELHFRKAAERLHMTQPPLSMQIRQLEESIGVDLFCRTTRSVQLTPAGKELQRRAGRFLSELDVMTQAVRCVGRGTVGSLSLGFPGSTMFDILPRLLTEQRSRYPQVTLNLKEMSSGELLESLRSRQLDVALVRASPSMMKPDLNYIVAGRESMVLALPIGHSLARFPTVPIEYLDKMPFIGFSADGAQYFLEFVQRMFKAHDLRPVIVQESVLPTILALVEARLGLALVPESMARLRTSELTYRPLAGADGMDVITLYCAWRQPDAVPVVGNFIDIVAKAAAPEVVRAGPLTQGLEVAI